MYTSRIESTDYQCYLLRLRRDGEDRPWRASLHCSSTGTLHHFANTASLIAFLQTQTNGEEVPTVNGDGQVE